MLQEHDGKNRETEEELLPSGHQAPKLELAHITSTWHLIISKIFTILRIAAMYISCTNRLHILLAHSYLYYLSSIQYTAFYIILYYILTFFLLHFFSYLYLCIFSWVSVSYNFTVHGADLIYISLLIIFCIIVYVTNINLESACVNKPN